MQADTPIVVQFDRTVVPASLAGRVRVTPPIAGCDLSRAFTAPLSTGCRAVWINADTGFVIQHPRAVFSPLRTYSFTVSAGFAAPDGTVNTVDHTWNITTGSAPQVRSVVPADGSRDVPVDSVVTVAFSGGMSAAATASAIRLDPPVPGATVVRDSLDASRFILYPGRLLRPGTRYLVSVARTAEDQHHQPLLAVVHTSFTTGVLSSAGHAVVLEGRRGDPPTRVVISSLEPAEVGAPVPDATVLEAPDCRVAAGCGVAAGQPLLSYSAAVLSAGGRWLAVVEHDLANPGAAPTLVVLNAANGATRAVFPGADMPAWSPDGVTLAYAVDDGVALYRADTGRVRLLPPGDPLLSAPVWGPGGELLALEVAIAPGEPRIQLADAVAAARYALPGLDGACRQPEVSPDGTQLAVVCEGISAPGAWLAPLASAAAARFLDPDLLPVGYAEPGTLLAVDHPSHAAPRAVLVDVDSDEQVPLARPLPEAALPTVVVSASLRRLAFVAPDARGVGEAWVENSDGSAAVALTSLPSGMAAEAVSLSG